MKLLDANVLLYAYNSDSPHHEVCRTWLEQAFNGAEPIGLPWQTR
jgi:predicted nucleic acid-binding protein